MKKRLSKILWYGEELPNPATSSDDLEGLHKGELFLHLKDDGVTLWSLSADDRVVEISGDGDGDLSQYLLKSIWDKVWEIKTDSQGNEYIFSKLPVVTQYGITMYADGGELNLPSIYAGLPIDGSTLIRDDNGVLMINPDIDLGGGASTWDELIGKPTWIGNTKPSYTYSEISQTPDLSVYALAKDLEDYVTLNTEQTIAAHKNFLNGLSVGGLSITKSQDDVIYLDANLVVRGGITMYATDTVDVPSIIDSLPIASTSVKGLASFDPNFFSVDANGNVSFIGSTGGVDESVLADYAKKTDLSAYLPLSGGTINGVVRVVSSNTYGVVYVGSESNISAVVDNYAPNGGRGAGLSAYATYGEALGTIGIQGNGVPFYLSSSNQSYVLLHSGNWSQYVTAGDGGNYLPITGGILTGPLQTNISSDDWSLTSLTNKASFYASHGGGFGIFSSVNHSDSSKYLLRLHYNDSSLGGSGNVAMLVRCDGHVGVMTDNPSYEFEVSGNAYVSNWIRTGVGGWYSELYGGGMYMEDSTYIRTYGGKIVYIQETGIAGSNAYGIGGHTLQLLIGGESAPHASILLRSNTVGWGIASNTNGNMYIGQRPNTYPSGYGSDSYVLELSTSGLLCYGGITMYSDMRKKTKLQDVELSLKQIADAPLIEHYYNSDDKRTTHVGSIAQYWASMNDWFCKEDAEGFYTMEIQNAALASAISIARELVKYESKTDKEIRLLKDEVKRLKKEIKILKSV